MFCFCVSRWWNGSRRSTSASPSARSWRAISKWEVRMEKKSCFGRSDLRLTSGEPLHRPRTDSAFDEPLVAFTGPLYEPPDGPLDGLHTHFARTPLAGPRMDLPTDLGRPVFAKLLRQFCFFLCVSSSSDAVSVSFQVAKASDAEFSEYLASAERACVTGSGNSEMFRI